MALRAYTVILIYLAFAVVDVDWLVSLLLVQYPSPLDGVVLVTGASAGVGKDAAYALAAYGFDVLVAVRKQSNYEKVLAEASLSSSAKGRLHSLILDVANRDQRKKAILAAQQLATEKRTRYVGLVTSAAIFTHNGLIPAELEEEDSLRQVFDVNFFGSVGLAAESAKIFRRQGMGRIILISSVAGRVGFPLVSSYAASKFAIWGWADTIRKEIGDKGVSVTVIEPGFIQSEMTMPGRLSDKGFAEQGIVSMKSKLNQPDVAAYQENLRFFNFIDKTGGKYAPHPNSSTTPAILHAMTSSHPKSHYYPGNFFAGTTPARLFVWLADALPTRVLDLLTFAPSMKLIRALYSAVLGVQVDQF